MLETINVYKLDKNATLPTRAHATDCGLDLYSLEDVFIRTGSTKNIKTGIAIQVPVGFIGKLEDRSSMALKGLRTGAGVVDPGYAGDISVVIHNISADTVAGPNYESGYLVKKGERVGQLVISKIETPFVVEVQELWNSSRGKNGFGSSGR